jgi:hypothetical protein
MKSVLLVLAALLAVAFAGSDNTGTLSGGITFNSGVNVSSSSTSANYREVISETGLLGMSFYISIEVSEQTSGTVEEVEADALLDLVIPPFVMSMYFYGSGSISGLTGASGFSGVVSGAAIATHYASIDEVNSAGVSIGTVDLASLTFGTPTVGSSNYLYTSVTVASATTSSGAAFSVKFASVVSSITGFLSVGGALVSPKSIEVIIEMDDITYSAAGNHLRLTAYSVTASTEASVSGNVMVTGGSGPSQTFVKFSENAVVTVDGAVSNVAATVSLTANTDSTTQTISNAIVQALITANSSLVVNHYQAIVDFPAGASSISYDPAQGFDASLYSGASTLAAPVALILLSAVFALFL